MLLLRNGLVFMAEAEPRVMDILIDNGLIKAVGGNLDGTGAEIIDCSGKFVTPGFIDAHCHIGMWEDGIGDEGADGNEVSDPITPELRAIDGINPFDPCFNEALCAGVTTVITGPGSANVIGGQFAALKTAGRSVEDMLVCGNVAMKAALGENPKRVYAEQKASPYTRMAIAALFRKTMVEAQEYAKKLNHDDDDKHPERDLALESLIPVLERELVIKVHAHRADDILTAFRLASEFNIRISIEHCTEGHLIAELLKEYIDDKDVSVVLGPLLSERPKVEMKNLTLRAPKILHDAGIKFALMTDHPVVPIQHLPVCAALCVKEGLDEQTALEAITINAARAVGLDKRLGSILPGKDADIAVFNKHPLDIRGNCVLTIINGRTAYEAK